MEIEEIEEIEYWAKRKEKRNYRKNVRERYGKNCNIVIRCQCGKIITTMENERETCLSLFNGEQNAFKYSSHYNENGHRYLSYLFR